MKNRLFVLFDHFLRSNPKGWQYLPLKGLLRVLSWLWIAGAWIRNKGYAWHIFYRHKAALPVISIGNITAGGSGKTPLTALLAEKLMQQIPNKVAIATRGYLSLAEKSTSPILVHKKEGVIPSWLLVGDEAAMLSDLIPEAFIFVGKHRYLSANMAKELEASCLLLDDGLQYEKLQKDLQIIALHGEEILRKQFVMPRGILRQPFAAIQKADLLAIFLEDKQSLKQLKPYLYRLKSVPYVIFTRKILGLKNKTNRLVKQMPKKAAVFCGIAHPNRFFKQLAALGIELVNQYILRDHGIFDLEILKKFSTSAKNLGAEMLICTHKDFVKLPKGITFSLPITYAVLHLDILQGENRFKNMVEKIAQRVNNY